MSAARVVTNRARRSGSRNAVAVWLVQHLRSLTGTVAQIRQNPGTAIMTACVIGVALALPAGLYVTLANVNAVAARWGANPQGSLFLAADTTLAGSRRVRFPRVFAMSFAVR